MTAQTTLRLTGAVVATIGFPGKEITDIISDIIDTYQLVKQNKKSCQSLVDKVNVTKDNLENGISPSCGQEAIKAYIIALRNIQEFLKKQIKPCGIFRKYLTAKDVANEVVHLTNELNQSSLALTLAVVMKIDREVSPMEYLQTPRAVINAIRDHAPLGDLMNDMKILPLDITDYPNEEAIPTVRGSRIHVKKRYHTKGFGAVAEKHIGKFNSNEKKEEENFWGEIAIWKQLVQAPGILKFYGIIERNGEMFTISEWANNSDLESYFKIENPKLKLGWDQKVKISSQVAAALAFCHSMEILHHDVRSHNVLLDKNLDAKLTNFQLSRKVQDALSKDVRNKMALIRWTAPERMVGADSKPPRFTTQCDIYSYGILLWEIATQQLPFGDINNYQVQAKVKAGKRPTSMIPDIPPKYKKYMEKAWHSVPGSRPAMSIISKGLCKLNESNKKEDEDEFPGYVDLVEDDKDRCCIEKPEIASPDTGIKFYQQRLYEKAWPIIKKYANQNIREAQYYAGNYFIYGHTPVQKDIKTGLNYWRLAADNRYAEAAYRYSLAYSRTDAEAGEKDLVIHGKYFLQAIILEHPGALYNAGISAFQKKKYEKCRELLQKAHVVGNVKAMPKLEALMKEPGWK
ncbi:hypothetical protein G9A89_001637 [Geosiphon pyriformis]|nr:hypothetical protein G9A89_001637 [Geosiphon pyriformis]